ncbi:hypothetical protein V7O66_07995 [Methanolobus sp. ZRKC3]|uniref:hypothetical protein n=1 Tax=Methanolobus sp. ZRKC3 TaxID=3125786 RepID=UPI00324DF6B3
MSKNKKSYCKDITELEEILYEGNYETKKKYNDAIGSGTISPLREKKLIEFVNPSLKMEKIKEKDGVKTPDFIIESESLFIEVTSINAPHICGEIINPSYFDIPRKINDGINHIEEKDKLNYVNFSIGGAIFIDIRYSVFTNIMDEKSLIEYIQKSTFINSNVDFLLICADSEYVNGVSSVKHYPPFVFVKNERIKSKITEIFPMIKNVIILS